MNGRNLLLGGLGALAMAGVVRRRGSRSEQDAPSLDKISVPGVTVHPRSEWPTGIRTRTGTYGACPGDLHTTQGLVYADLVAKKEREIRDVLKMTPGQRAALHGCDWVPAEHAGMPGVSVVRVRGRWWVYDGHHGLAAYRRLGIEPIAWRATLAANGDPIAAPRLFARRTGSRSEWAELGRASLPAEHVPSIQKLVHVVSLAKLAAIWRDREDEASGNLVAWVEISLGAGSSYREGIPIDDVLDRMRDWADGESDAVAVERCHEDLVLLAKHFNRLRFPLTVYRGLQVNPKKIVDVQEPGDHWTPNRAVAIAFAEGRHQASHRQRTGDDSGEPVLLSGTISGPHAVRWRETFNGYFGYTVDNADDPEVAEQQVATSLVRDVQVIPLSTPGQKRKKRTAGSRATIRAKAQRFDAMIDGAGAILPRIPSWSAVQRHLQNDLQFETDSDYGTTFKDMVFEAFDTLKRRQPEARNTPASGRAPTRQNAEALAWEWIHGRYDDFVASAARFTDPLILYREVTARRHTDIRIDGLGVSWSWDPEAAEAHWSRGGENWLLVASVSAQYVDWMATATANVTMPYEREITLIPGSPVLLLRIRSDAGVTVVDEWGTA